MKIMENRYARLRAEMEVLGIDGMYVSSPENYLYMSRFDNPDGYMFITLQKSWLFADFRYIEAARAEAYARDGCAVCEPGKPTLEEILRDEGIRRIGYEDTCLTCAELAGLQKRMPEAEWVPTGNLFSRLRVIKTRDEVDNIIAAQRIAEGAFQHIVSVLRYDMTEMDVAAELEYYMKKHGSEKPSFDTIAVSGTASSRPHGVPRPVKLEKGFLTMDFGAMINGYHSDMTRTVCIGKADEDMKKLYYTVLEAQRAALDAAAPGMSNKELDKVARDIIDGAGYAGCFGHGLGHGVGLQIHESPRVSPSAGDAVLHPGEIVTIEPGIYLEGRYGCRIEDMLYITENGTENLTCCPKELIEL